MLKTDWVRIGLSGATIDGRKIKPEWLEEIAKNYNTDVYTAVINYEHSNYYGSFGDVVELKTEKENDKTALYAILHPNKHLVNLNAEGEKLFCSMEINLKFADTKKPYLEGLAVTDRPASLGTQKLEFTEERPTFLYSNETDLVLTVIDSKEDTPEEKTEATPQENPEVILTKETKTENETLLVKLAQKLGLSVDKKTEESVTLSKADIDEIKILLSKADFKNDKEQLSQEIKTQKEQINAFGDELKNVKSLFTVLNKTLQDALKEQPTTPIKLHTQSENDRPRCL